MGLMTDSNSITLYEFSAKTIEKCPLFTPNKSVADLVNPKTRAHLSSPSAIFSHRYHGKYFPQHLAANLSSVVLGDNVTIAGFGLGIAPVQPP